MAEPIFSNVGGSDGDDDLPRTLRREREAQARRVREHSLDGAANAPMRDTVPAPAFQTTFEDHDDGFEPQPAMVTRLDIPFLHLMLFFLKAVLAGIPAIILLVALLWGLGEILTHTFPQLIKMQILIRMPN